MPAYLDSEDSVNVQPRQDPGSDTEPQSPYTRPGVQLAGYVSSGYTCPSGSGPTDPDSTQGRDATGVGEWETSQQTRCSPAWERGKIAALKGQPVKLRFTLRETALYSFWIDQ